MSTTVFLELNQPEDTDKYDLAVWNGNLDKIDSGVKAATEQSATETSATVELKNNTHHQCGSVSALTVTYAEGLHRATLSVTATVANAITLPTGTICSGIDCTDGAFAAVSGKRYTIAVLYDGVNYTAAVTGYETT